MDLLPLDGIKVLECATWVAGPAASAWLGDLGAEVVKVEEPGRGDSMRGLIHFFGLPMEMPGGRNALFEIPNRNKKSITIDLRKEKGRQILYKLVPKFDIFLTNILPRAQKRFGIEYETISKINPKIIYVENSIFGTKGPLASAPGFDLLAQARSGVMMVSGAPGMPPVHAIGAVGDAVSAMMCTFGAVVALQARDRHGIGQKVSTSQILALMSVCESFHLGISLLGKGVVPRFGGKEGKNGLYNWYQCKDCKWIALTMQQEPFWPRFCNAVNRPDLEKDPRFEKLYDRLANYEALYEILRDMFASKTSAKWVEILGKGDRLAFSVIQDIPDLPGDPQILANDYIFEYDHPLFGKIKLLSYPVQFEKTPAKPKTWIAPEVGEHTEEILCEMLNYSWDEIIELKDEGVI